MQDNLVSLLEEVKTVLADLAAATRGEAEAIVHHNLAELQVKQKEKEDLQKTLLSLERSCREATGGQTLREAIYKAPQEQQDKLTALHRDLKEAARELVSLNEVNALLLKQGLAYFRQLRENITGGQPGNYDGRGRPAAETREGLLVSDRA